MSERVLITGATSGIGRALAVACGARGARVALTGRRADLLAAAGRDAARAGAADVLLLEGSVTEDADVRRHARALADRFGGVDLAILNAGIGGGDRSRAEGYSAAEFQQVLDTNLFGVCRWIEALLPGMRAAGSGTIAGVSSPAGWRGFPGFAPYAASKSALSTALESLRIELRGSGVRIVTVEPGYVRSEITAANGARSMPFLLDSADAAARLLRGLDRGAAVLRFPRRSLWPLRALCSVLPRSWFDALLARAGRRGRTDAAAIPPR